MSLTDLLQKTLRSTALGLALYLSGCGGSSSSGCQTDYDCREPRVCRQGECVDSNEGEGEAEAEGASIGNSNNSGNDSYNSLQNLTGKIVFMSVRDTNNESNYEIYSIDADGNNVRRLTNNTSQDLAPQWSPNGSKIAFVSDWEIYTMDADGTNTRRLTQTGDFSPNANPSWSPDGRRIAFESSRNSEPFDIYIMDADGSNLQNLTNNPSADDYSPAWSSDGRKMVFASNRNNGCLDIYVMNADGSGQHRLTYDCDNGRESRHPAWFPGLQILFSSTRGTGLGLYMMNPDGSGAQSIAPSGSPQYSCWSPDRDQIAYSLGNNNQINITTPNGAETIELTQGAQPSWAL